MDTAAGVCIVCFGRVVLGLPLCELHRRCNGLYAQVSPGLHAGMLTT